MSRNHNSRDKNFADVCFTNIFVVSQINLRWTTKKQAKSFVISNWIL